MSFPAHRFLEEFQAQDSQLSNIVRALRSPPTFAESECAIEARIEDAYSQGYNEGQAAAMANLEAQIAALRADYDERLERTKSLYCESLADKLTSNLVRQIEIVQATISDQLVSALLPVMQHVLTEATVRQLTDELGGLLSEANTLTIELQGPKEMVDRIINRLADLNKKNESRPQDPARFKCIVDEIAEVRITANDTVIEARLTNWIERITAAVE